MGKIDSSRFQVGTTFGEWTVIRLPEMDADDRQTKVWCRCSCGAEKQHLPSTLSAGQTSRCKACATSIMKKRHGMSHTPEHDTWREMRKRCNSAEDSRYGGRGIRVCERWEVFENFYADMGPRPNGHSIERIDNNGDYAPGNCVWADNKTQARNRRSSRKLTINNETRTLAEWSEKSGVEPSTLWARAAKEPVGEALLRPTYRAKTYRYQGKTMTAGELVKETGVASTTLHRWLRKTSSVDEAVTRARGVTVVSANTSKG